MFFLQARIFLLMFENFAIIIFNGDPDWNYYLYHYLSWFKYDQSKVNVSNLFLFMFVFCKEFVEVFVRLTQQHQVTYSLLSDE